VEGPGDLVDSICRDDGDCDPKLVKAREATCEMLLGNANRSPQHIGTVSQDLRQRIMTLCDLETQQEALRTLDAMNQCGSAKVPATFRCFLPNVLRCLGVDNRLRREACRYADIPEVFSRKLAPDTIVKRMREVYNIPSRPDEQQDPRDTPPKQDRGGVKRPAPDREMTRSSPHEAPPQEQSTKTPAQNGTAVGRIQVKVVDQEGGEVTFKLKRSTPMQRLMDLYCAQVGLEASHVRFLLDEGTSIAPESTADSLGLVDGTCIECIED